MEKNLGFNIIDSKEWESVIEIDNHVTIQKHLNQWRHDYDLIIITCIPMIHPTGNWTDTYLSVMRRRRQ
mgnify:FL=1